MTKDEWDEKIEEWHESLGDMPLHEYLNMTPEEYSLFVEFDIMPGDPIPTSTFMALRSDAYRWANNADNHMQENRRYKDAIAEFRAWSSYDGPMEIDTIQEILDRHNV